MTPTTVPTCPSLPYAYQPSHLYSYSTAGAFRDSWRRARCPHATHTLQPHATPSLQCVFFFRAQSCAACCAPPPAGLRLYHRALHTRAAHAPCHYAPPPPYRTRTHACLPLPCACAYAFSRVHCCVCVCLRLYLPTRALLPATYAPRMRWHYAHTSNAPTTT